MPVKVPPCKLHFEAVFLEHYAGFETRTRKTIDKAVQLIATNPNHSSLNTHKAKHPIGGTDVFIAYASRNLRITFEYGPGPGMIALRNCGHHDTWERSMRTTCIAVSENLNAFFYKDFVIFFLARIGLKSRNY